MSSDEDESVEKIKSSPADVESIKFDDGAEDIPEDKAAGEKASLQVSTDAVPKDNESTNAPFSDVKEHTSEGKVSICGCR